MKLDLLQKKAKEETALFHRQSLWLEEDLYISKFKHFLSPHSNNFYSELRGIFSFEIQKLESLNYFEFISFRDGILPLMCFFQRYPTPDLFKKRIFIHSKMGAIVPEAWKGQISFYDFNYKVQKDNSKLVLSLFAQEDQFEKSQLLELFKTTFSKYEEFQVLISEPVLRGEDLPEGRSTFFQKIVFELGKLNKKITFVNLNELLGKNLSEWDFYDFNPRHFWYSWSYIEQVISMKGAQLVKYSVESLPDGIEQSPSLVLSLDPEKTGTSLYFKLEGGLDRSGQSYDEVKLFSDDLFYLAKKIGKTLDE